jgi:Putative beta-barrel porin-2, OmpL-like. bbp2
MNRLLSSSASLAVLLAASTAFSQDDLQTPSLVAPTAYSDDCACEYEPSCDYCLGDAWTLQSCLTPCCSDYRYGGWIGMGYYNNQERFSNTPNDGFAFLDYPDHLNLDQAWFYAEKVADAGCYSADYGFRFDMLYGVDAQKTQAFGNGNSGWDVAWDHGPYGWAMPQAYVEVAFDDWSVKIGHFFTIIGYEVVPDTGNFFYSHSFTMFNSEPFTHTGVLATYSASDRVTLYAGWTLGWDTGFSQGNLAGDAPYNHGTNGSNWLGGISAELTDDITVTWCQTAGNLGYRSAGEPGYSQSVVAIADVTDSLQYVLQSDWVTTDGYNGQVGYHEQDFGINQYLFYTLSDRWKAGCRMEWWKSNGFTYKTASIYELTGGINYKPQANVTIRPEIRYNWTPADFRYVSNDAPFNNTVFAIDAVVTF